MSNYFYGSLGRIANRRKSTRKERFDAPLEHPRYVSYGDPPQILVLESELREFQVIEKI